jgi:hypothetical protein
MLLHVSSPPVFSGIRVTRSLVLYVCLVDRCLSFCHFSLGHCVVCPSIYGFWLPLWYRQTLRRCRKKTEFHPTKFHARLSLFSVQIKYASKGFWYKPILNCLLWMIKRLNMSSMIDANNGTGTTCPLFTLRIKLLFQLRY